MKPRILLAIAVAILALAACGKREPPQPEPEPPPAPEPAAEPAAPDSPASFVGRTWSRRVEAGGQGLAARLPAGRQARDVRSRRDAGLRKLAIRRRPPHDHRGRPRVSDRDPGTERPRVPDPDDSPGEPIEILFAPAAQDAMQGPVSAAPVETAPVVVSLWNSAWLLEDLAGAGVLDRVPATLEFPEQARGRSGFLQPLQRRRHRRRRLNPFRRHRGHAQELPGGGDEAGICVLRRAPGRRAL